MNRSEWTQRLSRQQLAVIAHDTREHEARHPDQKQGHVHRDIEAELQHRDNERQNNLRSKD